MPFSVRIAGRTEPYVIDIPAIVPTDFAITVNQLCRDEFSITGGSIRNPITGNAQVQFQDGATYEFRGGSPCMILYVYFF